MKPLLFRDFGLDIATLSALVGFIMLVYKSLKEIREDRKQARAENLKITEKLDKLDEIHAIALKNQSGNKNLHRYLLQTELKIALQKGSTTSDKLDEVSNLYESYVALGGNGPIKALYEKFLQLPLDKEGQDEN